MVIENIDVSNDLLSELVKVERGVKTLNRSDKR